MSITKINLEPARGPRETFQEYKLRRKIGKAVVKNYLKKGTVTWVSCHIVPDFHGSAVGRKIKVNGTFRREVTDGRSKSQKKFERKVKTFEALRRAIFNGKSKLRLGPNEPF